MLTDRIITKKVNDREEAQRDYAEKMFNESGDEMDDSWFYVIGNIDWDRVICRYSRWLQKAEEDGVDRWIAGYDAGWEAGQAELRSEYESKNGVTNRGDGKGTVGSKA